MTDEGEVIELFDRPGIIQPEEWRPIPGYEGSYEVSSLGRVRSISRRVYHKDGGSHWLKGKIMRLFHSEQGYIYIVLKKEKPVRECVHRLVAKAFIPNDSKKRNHIDHIDGDKNNNTVSNLRWVTRTENMHNPITESRIDKAIGRRVIGISPEGNKKYYRQIKDVEKDGFNRHKVCSCCRGERKTHKKYTWRYINE